MVHCCQDATLWITNCADVSIDVQDNTGNGYASIVFSSTDLALGPCCTSVGVALSEQRLEYNRDRAENGIGLRC